MKNVHFQIVTWVMSIDESNNLDESKKNCSMTDFHSKPIVPRDIIEDCCICMSTGSNVETECGHQYCKECIETFHNMALPQVVFLCPLCRGMCSLYTCVPIVQFYKLVEED
jgi:hypothetical protein